MKHKILVIEDNTDISRLLVRILRRDGYDTMQAFSGTEAVLLLERELPDLILLDLMLPGMPGEDLLRSLREEKQIEIPVIVISAKDSFQDKISLLKNGADDYITKPFEPEEVTARVHACLRRCVRKSSSGQEMTCQELVCREIKLFPDSRKALVNEKELSLTAHEYDILLLLVQNPDKVYSREHLYELVWQGGYYGENNTVNVHISNLRRKIKAAGTEHEYIRTVYGIGFKLQ